MDKQEITEDIGQAIKRRGEYRKKLISEICDNFILLSKSNGMLSFPREHLTALISVLKLPTRTQQKVITEIIKTLLELGKVKEETINKAYYTMRNRALYSFDFGSFETLMKKNGYIKNEDGSYTETLPRDMQGVYTAGNRSVYRERIKEQPIKIYTII